MTLGIFGQPYVQRGMLGNGCCMKASALPYLLSDAVVSSRLALPASNRQPDVLIGAAGIWKAGAGASSVYSKSPSICHLVPHNVRVSLEDGGRIKFSNFNTSVEVYLGGATLRPGHEATIEVDAPFDVSYFNTALGMYGEFIVTPREVARYSVGDGPAADPSRKAPSASAEQLKLEPLEARPPRVLGLEFYDSADAGSFEARASGGRPTKIGFIQ